jgi:hypothetical protein
MKEVAIKKCSPPSEIRDRLTAALDWVRIEKGRATVYRKLFDEAFSGDERTRDHMFVYNELMDLVEVYELWKEETDNFPGIRNKIKEVFSNGPILREDERSDNSGNRPRNDAFTILVAGKLIKAGIPIVAVEGIPARTVTDSTGLTELLQSDIVARSNGGYISIECKRPQSKDKIATRIAEGRDQLSGREGIIAIDCSAALRPAETILESTTEDEAIEFLNTLVATAAKPIVEREFRKNVMGAIFFMRAPVHTVHKVSPVLSATGEKIITYTQYTASSLVSFGNGSSPYGDLFKKLADRLTASIQAKAHIDKT